MMTNMICFVGGGALVWFARPMVQTWIDALRAKIGV